MGRLYSKMKIFSFEEKVNSLPESTDKIMPPINLRIKPTNVCNHSCWYCAYRLDNLQLGKDMVIKDQIPKNKMMEIVEDIIEMDVKSVTFSGGGEPLVYPYMAEVIERLSQSSVKFAALTNGVRLQGRLAELFAHHGTWVRISIDGWDDASYAEYRGIREGEFSKVMKNMENFKKIDGECYLGISLIVDQKNAPHVHEFTKRLKDVGVDSIKISACLVSNNVAENKAYHDKIFDQVKTQIQECRHDFADDHFEINDSYHEIDGRFLKDYTWCPYVQISPVIGADLNVYCCHDKAYNIDEGVLGSIENQGFKDFWMKDKSKFFNINPLVHCNHHCMVNEKNKLLLEYLDIDKKHEVFV